MCLTRSSLIFCSCTSASRAALEMAQPITVRALGRCSEERALGVSYCGGGGRACGAMELSTNDYEPSAKDGPVGATAWWTCAFGLSALFTRVTREELSHAIMSVHDPPPDTQNPHKLLKTRDETGKVKMYPMT